jgi:hypothetical protein
MRVRTWVVLVVGLLSLLQETSLGAESTYSDRELRRYARVVDDIFEEHAYDAPAGYGPRAGVVRVTMRDHDAELIAALRDALPADALEIEVSPEFDMRIGPGTSPQSAGVGWVWVAAGSLAAVVLIWFKVRSRGRARPA